MKTSGNLIKNDGRQLSVDPMNKQILIKNQIVSARAEAARIIEEAEAYMSEARRQALEEAANLREQAYLEGVEKALTEFESYLIEAREIRERVWRETEQDLLRLAVRLTEKIIGREIKGDSKAIVNIVATALQNARQQEKLTIRINPADFPIVEKEIENFAPLGRAQFINFIADPRVSSGGCLIESEVGTIDARLETQLRVLERTLLAQAEGENSFS